MEKVLRDLKQKVWITKCCRFNAAKRYEIYNKYSNLTTALLASYALFLSVLQLLPLKFNNDLISSITIAISLFLISLSLYIWARDYSVKALKHHECGRKLAKMQDKVQIILERGNITSDNVETLINEYNSILDNYDNHKEIDLMEVYNQYKADFPNKIGTSECWFSFKFNTYYFMQVYLIYYLLLLGIPLISVLLLIHLRCC